MRTTFRRQVTLIVSLLLAATILLGVSFWGLFTHYVIRERESSLRGTAQSVVWLTQTSVVLSLQRGHAHQKALVLQGL